MYHRHYMITVLLVHRKNCEIKKENKQTKICRCGASFDRYDVIWLFRKRNTHYNEMQWTLTSLSLVEIKYHLQPTHCFQGSTVHCKIFAIQDECRTFNLEIDTGENVPQTCVIHRPFRQPKIQAHQWFANVDCIRPIQLDWLKLLWSGEVKIRGIFNIQTLLSEGKNKDKISTAVTFMAAQTNQQASKDITNKHTNVFDIFNCKAI